MFSFNHLISTPEWDLLTIEEQELVTAFAEVVLGGEYIGFPNVRELLDETQHQHLGRFPEGRETAPGEVWHSGSGHAFWI